MEVCSDGLLSKKINTWNLPNGMLKNNARLTSGCTRTLPVWRAMIRISSRQEGLKIRKFVASPGSAGERQNVRHQYDI